MSKNKDLEQSDWIIESEKVFRDLGIFRLKTSQRRRKSTNYKHQFLLVDVNDWTNVVAVTKEKEIVLVRQFRHGINQFVAEIPGGAVEPGETDLALAALRELREESGFAPEDSNKVIPLATVYPNPAFQSNKLHFFAAFNCQLKYPLQLDPGEDIEVYTVPYRQLKNELSQGKLEHALSLACLSQFFMRFPEAELG